MAVSWTSAFLYQILPDLMISSSRSFFQLPLMWTNLALSSKRFSSLATSLSAIHCHLSIESFLIACSSADWAKVYETLNRRRVRMDRYFFMVLYFNYLMFIYLSLFL